MNNIVILAAEKQISLNFVYTQKNKALQAIDNPFQPVNDEVTLSYLSGTKK